MNGNSEKDTFKRKHYVAMLLNDLEYEALNKYCKKYKVENRSKFIREAVITSILEKFDKDYPTLFAKEEINS